MSVPMAPSRTRIRSRASGPSRARRWSRLKGRAPGPTVVTGSEVAIGCAVGRSVAVMGSRVRRGWAGRVDSCQRPGPTASVPVHPGPGAPARTIGAGRSDLQAVPLGRPVGHHRVVDPIAPRTMMLVNLTGFAGDCLIHGRLDLRMDRLTDQLNAEARLDLVDVVLEGLHDGQRVAVPSFTVERSDLFAVRVDGPRGVRRLRVATTPHRLQAQIGPYTVLGRSHSRPGMESM